MNINQKIAKRRAELQRVQIAEDEQRKEEARIQVELRKEKEKTIKELAQKEVAQKIQQIHNQLGENKNLMNYETDRMTDVLIKDLAVKRITKGERGVCAFLFFGGILGFYIAWWLGFGMVIWATFYASKITSGHENEIRFELGIK